MRRSGLSRTEIRALRTAYRMIFDRSRPVSENLDIVEREFADSVAVRDVVGFLRNRGKRHSPFRRLRRSRDDTDDAEG